MIVMPPGGGGAAGSARRLLAGFLLSLLAVSPIRSSSPVGSVESFTSRLDFRIPLLMRRYEVPGLGIALIRDGEIVWQEAYGTADAVSGRPLAEDSIFRAESISKSVTAWGVQNLVERGRIDLDAPVQRYLGDFALPDSPFDPEKVTVRRLLSGNAGMVLGPVGPSVEYAPGTPRPALREALAGTVRMNREPGSGFEYSNVGFNLLELVVENVSGRPFADYMAEEILDPLGMKDSSFEWNGRIGERAASGHDLRGRRVEAYVYSEKGSGGLFTTVRDIAAFARAGMRAPGGEGAGVLSPESVRALHSESAAVSGMFGAVADAYGFGHFLERLPDGRKAVWHGGQGHGWMTHFHMLPESGDGIVILTNTQRSWPLISIVLADWSRWNGHGPVKFSRIRLGVAAMWFLTALLALAAFYTGGVTAAGIVRGRLRFAPLAPERRAGRALRAVVGAAGIAAIGWAASQPYLMVTSLFPGPAERAGGAVLALSALLLTSALFVRRGGTEQGLGPGAGRGVDGSRRGLTKPLLCP